MLFLFLHPVKSKILLCFLVFNDCLVTLRSYREFLFCNFHHKLWLSYLNCHKNMVINSGDVFLVTLIFRDEMYF